MSTRRTRAEEQHIKFHVGLTDTRDVSNLGDVATSPTSTNEDAEEWNPSIGWNGNNNGCLPDGDAVVSLTDTREIAEG